LKTIPSTVNAAVVKTAAVISKAAVTLRLIVHPRQWDSAAARGFAWNVGVARVGW